MEDFAGEAVKRFLGALYSGEILLEKHLFRDVNKLCHVFKVEWLAGRCGDYFTSLVGGVSPSSDYQTLLFLFEEARFCSRVMKCDRFLDLLLEKIYSLENRAEIFVEPFMRNYSEVETSQLDLILQITRSNPVILLKIMQKNIESEGKMFDEASRYLLQNVDLCKCISEDEASFEELFDVLDSATQSSDSDALFVNKLYKKSVKEFKKTVSLSSSSPSNTVLSAPVLPQSTTEASFEEVLDVLDSAPQSSDADALFVNKLYWRSTKEFKKTMSLNSSSTSNNTWIHPESAYPQTTTEIPHIFCSYERFRRMSTQEYLNAAKESPLVLNLYMLIEGFLLCDEYLTPDMVHEIEMVRRKRGWSRISPEFLDSLDDSVALDHALEQSNDLTSMEESVRLVGRVVGTNKKMLNWNSCTIKDLFETSKCYAFYFEHPDTTDCHLPGKCGFVLKFTPDMKSGQPDKFKVNLCLNQEEYPEGLHIHPEVVKADKIHLLPMFYERYDNDIQPDMCYCLATFTWNELGISEVTGEGYSLTWKIGLSLLDPFSSLKMVVFITL